MSPKSLLHHIGIKPIRKKCLSEQFQNKKNFTGQEKNSLAHNSDIMSVQAIDMLFTDEKKAIETLGDNFDRLANSMDML